MLHPLAAQVEIPVAEAQPFINIDFLVDVEGRGLRLVQDLEAAATSSSISPVCHFRVDGAFRPDVDRAGDGNHVLVPQVAGEFVRIGRRPAG